MAQAGLCKGEELPLVTAVVTPRFVPSCTPTMLKVKQPVHHPQTYYTALCRHLIGTGQGSHDNRMVWY